MTTKAPLYIRNDPAGTGAYLHDAFDKHLGYVHRAEDAAAIVGSFNSHAKLEAALSKIAAIARDAADAQRAMNGEFSTFEAIARAASEASAIQEP